MHLSPLRVATDRLYPARGPCRRPRRGLVEHDREGADRSTSPQLAVRAGPRGHFRLDRGDQPDGWNFRGLSRFDRAAMEKAGVGERRRKELTQVNEPSWRAAIVQALRKLAGRAAHAKRQRERAGDTGC